MESYENLKLEDQICFRLYVASREIIKKYKPILEEHNLTYTQYLTMLVLWEERKISVKKIGERLHLDSGTLTPLLEKIEQMGLIIKYRDPNDDRVVIVELTDKGADLQDKVKDVPKEISCSVGLSKEKLVELKKDLDELIKIL